MIKQHLSKMQKRETIALNAFLDAVHFEEVIAMLYSQQPECQLWIYLKNKTDRLQCFEIHYNITTVRNGRKCIAMIFFGTKRW